VPAEGDRFRRAEGACLGHDTNTAVDGLERPLDELPSLVMREGEELAGCATGHDSRDARIDLSIDDTAKNFLIDTEIAWS